MELAQVFQNKKNAARFAEERLNGYLPKRYTERWIIRMILMNLGIFTFVNYSRTYI